MLDRVKLGSRANQIKFYRFLLFQTQHRQRCDADVEGPAYCPAPAPKWYPAAATHTRNPTARAADSGEAAGDGIGDPTGIAGGVQAL